MYPNIIYLACDKVCVAHDNLLNKIIINKKSKEILKNLIIIKEIISSGPAKKTLGPFT